MSERLVASFEKRFSREVVISGEFEMPADRFHMTVLLGPSGCGKTTLLRCLAGLERPEKGQIHFGEEVWCDASGGAFRSPQQRDVGLLFQDYALFPHLTVAENIGYGLRKLPATQRQQRVGETLERMQLDGLEHRYPREISGGQQQRVALGRVLVRRPRLLLLDEPLSALDATLRETLRGELRAWLVGYGIPVLLVTHDPAEALALGDLALFMESGKIRHQGPPQEVLR